MDNTKENKQASADLKPEELSEVEKIQAMMKQATPEFDPANYSRVYYPKKRTSCQVIHKCRPYPNRTWRNPNATAPSKSPPVVLVAQQNFTRKNTLTRHPKVFNMNRGAVLTPKDRPAVPIINNAAARLEANKAKPFVKQPVNPNFEKSGKPSSDVDSRRSRPATPTFQHQPAQDMPFSINHHPSWGQIPSPPPNFGFQRPPFRNLNGSPEYPEYGLPPPQQQEQWEQTPRMWMPPNDPPPFRPIQSLQMIPVAPPPGQRFYGSSPPENMPNWSSPPHSHMRHGPPQQYYGGPSPPMIYNDYELGRLATNAHGSPPQRMDEPFRDMQPKHRLSKIDDPEVEFNLFLAEMDRRKMMAQHTTGARKRPRSRSNSPVHKRTFRYSPKRRHSRRSSSRSPIRSPTTQRRSSAATTRARSWDRRDEKSRSPLKNPSPTHRQDNRSCFINLPDEGCKRKEKRTQSPTSTKSSSSSERHYSKKERMDKTKNEKRRKSKD